MNRYLLIFMMALMTAPSRILPAFFLSGRKLPESVETFLNYIPYAVLGALIFPDVLTATGDLKSSAAGAAAALALGLWGRGPLTVLAGAIAAAFAVSAAGF